MTDWRAPRTFIVRVSVGIHDVPDAEDLRRIITVELRDQDATVEVDDVTNTLGR